MMNGFSSIFMVASVSAVPLPRRTGRDEQGAFYGSAKQNGKSLFAGILADTMDRQVEEKADCSTTTYGRDRQLQTFLHRTREYHY